MQIDDFSSTASGTGGKAGPSARLISAVQTTGGTYTFEWMSCSALIPSTLVDSDGLTRVTGGFGSVQPLAHLSQLGHRLG